MIRKDKLLALKQKMSELGIREADIQENFIPPGSKGGQKANKTACAVQLKHLPTGTEAKSNKSRLREDNRFFARRILTEKLETIMTGKSPSAKKTDKIKKQKRRRQRRSLSKLNGCISYKTKKMKN